MTLPDDIPMDTPPPETEPVPPPPRRLRSVGPESETRGGSEAPEGTLGEVAGSPAPSMSGKDSSSEPLDSPPDGMPGSRAALPPGSLPKPYLGPQGDENRDPPANAPTAPAPSEIVEGTLRNTTASPPDRG